MWKKLCRCSESCKQELATLGISVSTTTPITDICSFYIGDYIDALLSTACLVMMVIKSYIRSISSRGKLKKLDCFLLI